MTLETGGSPSSSSALRLDSALPASTTRSAPERLTAVSPPMMAGSSPTRVSVPACSPSAAIRRRSKGAELTATMSRISRARRESLPIRAMVKRESPNLMLRGVRWRCMAKAASQDASDTDGDAAGDVCGGHDQQQRLRKVPHAGDECAQQNEDQRRVRLGKIDALEAVVAPGADHEETEQTEQREPGDAQRPQGDGVAITGEYHGSHQCGRGGD